MSCIIIFLLLVLLPFIKKTTILCFQFVARTVLVEEGEVIIEAVDLVVREVTITIAREVMRTAREGIMIVGEVMMTVGVDTMMVVGEVMEVTRAERGEAMRAGEEEVGVTAITLEVRVEGVINSRRGHVMKNVGSRRPTTHLQPKLV